MMVQKTMGYYSRTLTDKEKNLDTTYCEGLAIVWALLLSRSYLEGCRFIFRPDNHTLRCILNPADATGRLAHWRVRLLELDFERVHRTGVKHKAADALSSVPTVGIDSIELEEETTNKESA